MTSPRNLLIKYSDSLFGVGDVIERHRRVIESQGYVWLGKFGRPISASTLRNFETQIEEGTPTSAFLATGTSKGIAIHEAPIEEIRLQLDDESSSGIPAYYREMNLLSNVGFWMKLSGLEESPPDLVDRLVVISSGSSARFALRRSMNGFFLVSSP